MQISFGSNEDFIASDRNGKISSRGSLTPKSRLATVARQLMRDRAQTEPATFQPQEGEATKAVAPTPIRLKRRSTFATHSLHQPTMAPEHNSAGDEVLDLPSPVVPMEETQSDPRAAWGSVPPQPDPTKAQSPRTESPVPTSNIPGRRGVLLYRMSLIRTAMSPEKTSLPQLTTLRRTSVNAEVQTELTCEAIDAMINASYQYYELYASPAPQLGFGQMQGCFTREYRLRDGLRY